ncbi:MAG TPA: tetratricopeptide repeat protein [Burkholderiales bacterium]|nr:tetratricopeptide repeat protein [Burkholderiales bacterium]
MALDHEEKEQLAALKGWWQEHGNLIVTALVAVALAAGGWRGWNWYQSKQSLEASTLYQMLTRAVQAGDAKTMRDASGALAEDYPRTLYASMGALVSARYYFDHRNLKDAKAQLEWVLERSRSDDLKDLARLRLAAVLLDEKAYDEALKKLAAEHGEAYAAQYAALRGDVLVAKRQAKEAKAAYQVALDKAAKDDNAFRESVRVRLEALGG